MKVRFSTILTRGFLFSRLGASISASHRKFPNKKKVILKENLWDQGMRITAVLRLLSARLRLMKVFFCSSLTALCSLCGRLCFGFAISISENGLTKQK